VAGSSGGEVTEQVFPGVKTYMGCQGSEVGLADHSSLGAPGD
jgi:hypothetical protein